MFTIIRNKLLTNACKSITNTSKLKPKIIRKYKTLHFNQENLPRALPLIYLPTAITRHKSKSSKSKNQSQEESSDEEEDKEPSYEDQLVDKSTRIINLNVTSMRLDGILKSGLQLSRNKVELMFYESKVRLNGEKVLKKSVPVYAGDEIDLIRGLSPKNPNFLIVSRVEVLDAKGEDESIKVKVRRCKSLMIENYKYSWKGSVVA